MPDIKTDIACLFCKDSITGNRQVSPVIVPGSIIGFMNATPWCGNTRDRRRINAIQRIENFIESITSGSGAGTIPLTPEQMLSYASPVEIDVEDPIVHITRAKELDGYQAQFAERYLMPLVSADNKKIPLAEAKSNMRISFVGFSFGGMFIACVRKHLAQRMQEIGYTGSEIKEIFQQVYHISFGVPQSPEAKIEPRFNEVKLVTRLDNQGIWESFIDPETFKIDRSEKFVVIENNGPVHLPNGKIITKPHSQIAYMDALKRKPELCQEILHNITSTTPAALKHAPTREEEEFIEERLKSLSYKLQKSNLHWR